MRVAERAQVRPGHGVSVRDAVGDANRAVVVHVGLVAAGYPEAGEIGLVAIQHGGPAVGRVEELAVLEAHEHGLPGSPGGGVDVEASGDGQVLGGELVALVGFGQFVDDRFGGLALEVRGEAPVGNACGLVGGSVRGECFLEHGLEVLFGGAADAAGPCGQGGGEPGVPEGVVDHQAVVPEVAQGGVAHDFIV